MNYFKMMVLVLLLCLAMPVFCYGQNSDSLSAEFLSKRFNIPEFIIPEPRIPEFIESIEDEGSVLHVRGHPYGKELVAVVGEYKDQSKYKRLIVLLSKSEGEYELINVFNFESEEILYIAYHESLKSIYIVQSADMITPDCGYIVWHDQRFFYAECSYP